MPIYQVSCEKGCGAEPFEIFCCMNKRDEHIMNTRCPKCSGPVKQDIVIGREDHWFKPFISEDFDGTPIEVTSVKHYRELCKRFGVYAKAL